MPRPYSPPSGRPPRSSRRRARWAATRAAMVMANQAAAAVSWLACGSPSDAQARVVLSRLSAARQSRAQHEAAARFLARARPFARRGSLNLRGGRAVVASQLPPLLTEATYNRTRPYIRATAPTESPAQQQHQAQPHAQPAATPAPACSHIVAERVSLPTAGATVPIAPWLPSEWQAHALTVCCAPIAALLSASRFVPQIPRSSTPTASAISSRGRPSSSTRRSTGSS